MEDYRNNVYNALKGELGDSFDKSFKEFSALIDSDDTYASNVYGALKGELGDSFEKSEEDFYSSLKKKEELGEEVSSSLEEPSTLVLPPDKELKTTEAIASEAEFEPRVSEELSFQEQGEKQPVNYMGLFDKKDKVKQATESGVSVSFAEQTAKAASQAERPISFLNKSSSIKKRIDGLRERFPNEAMRLEAIASQPLNSQNIDDVDEQLGFIESQIRETQTQRTLEGDIISPEWYEYKNTTLNSPVNIAVERLQDDNEKLRKAATGVDVSIAGEAISVQPTVGSGIVGGVVTAAEAIKEGKGKELVKGVGRGLKEYAEGYTQLLDDLKKNRAVTDLLDKVEKIRQGEDVELTSDDRLLLKAVVENSQLHGELDEEIPSAYKIGEAVGTSLGFMSEFVLTGAGAGAIGKQVLKGVVKTGAKKAVGKFGVGMAVKLAQAGVQTAKMPSFYKKTAENVSNGMNFGEAVLDSYWETGAEVLSERIFMKNPVSGGVGNSTNQIMQRMGINFNVDKGAVGVLKNVLEESAEEKIGEIMTAPKDYESFGEFWEGFTDKEQNKIMLGSVGLMTGTMGSVAVAGNSLAETKRKAKVKRLEKFVPSDLRAEIDIVLENTDLSVKQQYDLIADAISDRIESQELGEDPATTAGNAMQYAQWKVQEKSSESTDKNAVVKDGELTLGEVEEVGTMQDQLDYLNERDVDANGLNGEQVEKLYEKTKAEEDKEAIDKAIGEEVVEEKKEEVKPLKEKEDAKEKVQVKQVPEQRVRKPEVKEAVEGAKEEEKAGEEKVQVEFEPFAEVVRESETVDEAFEKVQKIKDVTPEVSEAFREKYDPEQKLTPRESFEVFYNEIKPTEVTEKPVEPITPEKGVITPEKGKVAKKEVVEATLDELKNTKERLDAKITLTKAETAILKKVNKAIDQKEKIQKADDLISSGMSDIADIIGVKKSITGEERAKLIPAIQKVTEGLAIKLGVKGQALIDAVKKAFKDAGHTIDDELINETIKSYASKIEALHKISEAAAEEERREEGEPVRGVREEYRAEAPPKEKVAQSRFGVRMLEKDSKTPKKTREIIREQGLDQYTKLSFKEAEDIARNLFDANDLETAYGLVRGEIKNKAGNQLHPAVRIHIGVLINFNLNARINRAESKGDLATVNKLAQQQAALDNYLREEFSTKQAQGLAALNSTLVRSYFAPATNVREYKTKTSETRKKKINSKTNKRAEKDIKKDGKKLVDKNVDKALDSPSVKKIIDENKSKVSPVKPDRMKELRKKEKDLIERWRKARKTSISTTVIPGLTQADIEFGGELAVVYLEQAAYQTAKAIKKLVKTFKDIGVELTEADAKKLMPKEIDGVPIDEKLRKEEEEKAAESLANRIFGEVVDKKKKEDPLSEMINTLLGKFRERDIKKEKKVPKTDIEKIRDAILDKEKYKNVWAEARDKAIDTINENEKLTDYEKEEAIERVNNAYKEATEFTFTEAQVDKAIRKKLGDLDMRIRDIVKSHYDIQIRNRGKLVDALIEESGLTNQQATVLARAIERRFDTLMTESGKKLVDRYIKKTKETKTIDQRARKASYDELIELVNIGAFNSPEFREAFATARGIPEINEEHAKKIKSLSEKVQKQKRRSIRIKYTEDLLTYMQAIEGVNWGEVADAIWYGNVLSGLTTQERNILGAAGGVGINLTAEALGTFRLAAVIRGVLKGLKFGKMKAIDVWREGYSPFEERVELPNVTEVFKAETNEPIAKPFVYFWNKLKYVGRFMRASDMFFVTLGKESYLHLLAHEALNVNKWKYMYDSTYRKKINSMTDDFLSVSKEQLSEYERQVEREAEEYNYSESDKDLVLLEMVDDNRDADLVETAVNFGIRATGNVRTYGTIGAMSDMLAAVLNFPITIPVWNKITGWEKKKVRPLSYTAKFTKIAGNVGSLSLDFVPGIGAYRVWKGGYGSIITGVAAPLKKTYKEINDKKYWVELNPREKRSIMYRQALGLLATSALIALSEPGDDDDPYIRVTANGFGGKEWDKNKDIIASGEWKPYSLGIRVGKDKRLWVSYRYTPLILPLSPIGFARDAKKYRAKLKEESLAKLLAHGYSILPSFLADMTAIKSMTEAIGTLWQGAEGEKILMKPAKTAENIIKGFYSPGLYRDAIKFFEWATDQGIDVSNDSWDRLTAYSPVAILGNDTEYKQIDVLGREIKQKAPWWEFASMTEYKNDPISYHNRQTDAISRPYLTQLVFKLRMDNGRLYKDKLSNNSNEHKEIFYNFIKYRGEIIEKEITKLQNRGITGEKYAKRIKEEISDANEKAKLRVYRESKSSPIKVVEK